MTNVISAKNKCSSLTHRGRIATPQHTRSYVSCRYKSRIFSGNVCTSLASMNTVLVFATVVAILVCGANSYHHAEKKVGEYDDHHTARNVF
jgi:hypothetical protein